MRWVNDETDKIIIHFKNEKEKRREE